MRAKTLTTAALAALAITGCATVNPQSRPPGPTAPVTSTAQDATPDAATGTPTGPAGPSGANRPEITGTNPVTLAFAGDVHFEKALQPAATNPQGMAPLKSLLSKADVTVVNLETAITTGGTPQPGKPYTFRAPASALTTLANAGVDVAGMANNHSADYGDAGLADTLKAKANAPLKVIGIGRTIDEALAPAEFTIDGVSVAILNVTPLQEETTDFHTATATKPGVAALVKPYTSTAAKRFVAAVKDASARYDVVVVFLHWGTERETCPTAKQFEVEKMLSAAGADAIVGGHSHRVQAGGWTGNTYVDYGLGSFTWWLVPSDPATGILTLSIDKDRVKAKRDLPATKLAQAKSVVSNESWQAMLIGESGLPYVPPAADVKKLDAQRDGLMACSKLRATP